VQPHAITALTTMRDPAIPFEKGADWGPEPVWIFSSKKRRFYAPVQIGPGAHPSSYTMGIKSLPGVKRSRCGVDHPPPYSAKVKERANLYICLLSGPSWLVLGRTLPLYVGMYVCVYIYIYIYIYIYTRMFLWLPTEKKLLSDKRSVQAAQRKNDIYFKITWNA